MFGKEFELTLEACALTESGVQLNFRVYQGLEVTRRELPSISVARPGERGLNLVPAL